MKTVYFDSAATTKMRPEVIDAMTDTMQEVYGNPSSTHAFGRKAKSAIENARKSIAKQFGVSASEIFFTSGGTEADNLILQGAVRDLGVERIISTKIEHHAVLNTLYFLSEKFGTQLDFVDLDENGNPDLNHLETLLEKPQKTLVSLMHINNEIGNKLALEKVGEICQKYKALFHSDTVQSVGHFELDLTQIPIDFLAASAHKFHGPKGVGFVFIRKGNPIEPLIYGGSQERGLRAGTENMHNIVGMQTAFELAYQNLAEEREYVQNLKKYFIDQLQTTIPGILFNGNSADFENSTYTLINIALPVSTDKAALLLFQLDLKGIACSKGSACQSGSDLGSFVLNEIYDEERLKMPGLRFSFSHFNTKDEIDFVVKTLKEFALEENLSL